MCMFHLPPPHPCPAPTMQIHLRASLEKMYTESKSVPFVQLVVQGGPGTLATVKATAEMGGAVVVVVDSGGAATAIADFVLRDHLDPRFAKMEETLVAIRDIQACRLCAAVRWRLSRFPVWR